VKKPTFSLFVTLAFVPFGFAQTIAQWTFELNTPADLNNSATISSIAADVGSGTASGVHADAASDWSTPAGNGSANSFSVNTWGVGDYFQFQTSTLGFTGILLSWDQTSSGTGPRDFELGYSTDGINFTPFTTYSVLANAAPNPVWNATTYSSLYTFTYDLSAVTALDNDADVFFRLVNTSTISASGGTVAAAGTDRVDNFTVAVVPEPSTYVLGGLGLAMLIYLRRRKLSLDGSKQSSLFQAACVRVWFVILRREASHPSSSRTFVRMSPPRISDSPTSTAFAPHSVNRSTSARV
jgi:hypothetical protein